MERRETCTSSQVSNLRPFTAYSFRVMAVNALGTSKASEESYYTVTLRTGKERRMIAGKLTSIA